MQLEDIDLTRIASFGGDMPDDWFTFLRREAPVWYHPPVADVPELDLAASDLYKRSPRLARDYLTEYTVAAGDMVVERWRELHKQLLYKYLDGNVRDEHGKITPRHFA